MIAAHRRRMDKFDREAVFFTDNAADFPVGSPSGVITVAIHDKMVDIMARDADLTETLDDKHQTREIFGDARDVLLGKLRTICMGADAIGDVAVPGITALFNMPTSRTDQSLIAKADAMFAETAPYNDEFIAVGLETHFREHLIDAKDAFIAARAAVDSAVVGHGEAVGAIAELFRETMELSRQRSALVKLKYADNAGKMAAWAISSHLEKAPKKPQPPPTP